MAALIVFCAFWFITTGSGVTDNFFSCLLFLSLMYILIVGLIGAFSEDNTKDKNTKDKNNKDKKK